MPPKKRERVSSKDIVEADPTALGSSSDEDVRKRRKTDQFDNSSAEFDDSAFRQRLESDPRFEVEDLGGGTWIALAKRFYEPPKSLFDETWASHPLTFKTIKMFGKDTVIPRYQQAFGRSYAYSGAVSESIEETPLIRELMATVNRLMPSEPTAIRYNMCLCNWYEPDHYIGPHSDDTRQLFPFSPIASLSWGATRTFALSPRNPKDKDLYSKEIPLQNGDLVIMAGRCQQTHKHSISKVRKSQLVGNRINFTFRCFR